jgi:GxxExxY protein
MNSFVPISEEAETIARSMLDAAIEVHRQLGPGFLERIYEEALCQELTWRAIPFECQKPVQVLYKGVPVGDQRLDLLVGSLVIVEIKAVDAILLIHQAQLLSYLKTTHLRLGFLINFNVKLLKNGMKRMVL